MRAAQSNRSVRIHPGSIPLSVKPFFALAIAAAAFCLISIHAAEPAPPAMSAAELADRLNAVSQGNALIRTKLEVRPLDGARRVLQLQIKQRRTKTATDLVYQVLWPDEHKGEAVILHQAQGAAKGSIIVPQQPVRAIKSSEMNEGLFGSDLSYQDAVENFFAWKKQTLIGSETINGVNCQILESKPEAPSPPMPKCAAGLILSVLCRCGSRNILPQANSSAALISLESRVMKSTIRFQPV